MKKIIFLMLLLVVCTGYIAWLISRNKKRRREEANRIRAENKQKQKEKIEQIKEETRKEVKEKLREEIYAEYSDQLDKMQQRLDKAEPAEECYNVFRKYLKELYTLPAGNNHVNGKSIWYASKCFEKSDQVYLYDESGIGAYGFVHRITTLECLDPSRFLSDDIYWAVIQDNLEILISHLGKIVPENDDNDKHFREIMKVIKQAKAKSDDANQKKQSRKKSVITDGGIPEPIKDHDKLPYIEEEDDEKTEEVENIGISSIDDFIL